MKCFYLVKQAICDGCSYCCNDYSVLMYSDEIQLKETLETQGYQGIDVVVLAIVFSCIGMKYN